MHSRIDAAELPVTHVTRRQGRPYTLVLAKTDALFAREQEGEIAYSDQAFGLDPDIQQMFYGPESGDPAGLDGDAAS